VPITGGAYLRLLPFTFQKWAVQRRLREGEPFVVTIHPWELDPDQPRLPVGVRTRWTHYHNLRQTESRLGQLLSLSPYQPQQDVLRNLRLLP
jgi:hypothetical protein